MHDAAMYAGQDQTRKAAFEAINAAQAAAYRVHSALGSKLGKSWEREEKNRIKEAERQLERAMKHKTPEKMTPDDTTRLNDARQALESVSSVLVSRWEAEQASKARP